MPLSILCPFLFHTLQKNNTLSPIMDAFQSVAFEYGRRGLVNPFFGALCAALIVWYLVTYLISPLRRFPGPFLAGM
jgi:hypothetical protein